MTRAGYPQTMGECTWCHGPVAKPRRYWCSQECVDAYLAETDMAVARRLVEQRDHGVCAKCGVDTNDPERQRTIKSHGSWISKHFWEADHIKPRAQGGSNKQENLRTLCIACHESVTTEFARHRALERRVERTGEAQIPLLESPKAAPTPKRGGIQIGMST